VGATADLRKDCPGIKFDMEGLRQDVASLSKQLPLSAYEAELLLLAAGVKM
jgi:hypothetical protein